MTSEASRQPLLEEVGVGALDLDGSGQDTLPLNRDPVAKANRPPAVGWCDTSHIVLYNGTDFCCWYGRRADGRFHPYGKLMRLTDAGKRAVGAEATRREEMFSRRSA